MPEVGAGEKYGARDRDERERGDRERREAGARGADVRGADVRAAGAREPGGRAVPASDVQAALDAVPGVDTWQGLQPMERERREGILRGIRMRIAERGPRRAVPSPERGRLFMPFAALDGYEEMLVETEEEMAQGSACLDDA